MFAPVLLDNTRPSYLNLKFYLIVATVQHPMTINNAGGSMQQGGLLPGQGPPTQVSQPIPAPNSANASQSPIDGMINSPSDQSSQPYYTNDSQLGDTHGPMCEYCIY